MNEDPVVLNSALEILEHASPEIQNVRFYKIHAEFDPTVTAPPNDDDTDDPQVGVEVALRTRQDADELGVRLEFDVTADKCRIELDVAAEYVAAAPFRASEQAILEFANEVGIMAIYPYVREAVNNLTARTIGEGVVMPILPRGAMTFSVSGRVQPPADAVDA
jgi:preprotein translocase subunit SecB